jgi:hypothetical protein
MDGWLCGTSSDAILRIATNLVTFLANASLLAFLIAVASADAILTDTS